MTLSDIPPAQAERPPGPWDLAAAAAPPAAQPKQPAPGSQLAWGMLSTVLLAAWLTWQFGWVFAVAGVLGVFVHELGHLGAINALGCGPGRIHIIPFFGGAASMSRAPDSEFKGVLIALAGPVCGLVATGPFFLLFAVTHAPMWLDGAFFVAVINLLNLAPAPPLDGAKALGPVLAWINPWVERVALVLVGGAVVLWAVPRGGYLLALVAGFGVVRALLGKAFRAPARAMSQGEWSAAAGLCLGAVALCLATTFAATHGDPLGFVQRLGL